MLKSSIGIRAFVLLISLLTGSLLSPGISLAIAPQVAAGGEHTVGLKTDGTAVAVGENLSGQCDVDSWAGIQQVAAGEYHTLGIQADGTVVAVGWNVYGQCDVDSWTGIQQVTAGDWHTVGLKTDGTVVAVGRNGDGQCNVGSWTGIQQVAAGAYYTVGLKADGTVVAVGRNDDGQCNVGSWIGIQQVAAGYEHTIGLKTDGTAVAVGGDNFWGQRDVESWTGIQQVAAGGYHTVGLQADGTVAAIGSYYDGQCDVDSWTGIQQVTAGDWHTAGLQADGTVVAVGENDDGQCDVDDWALMQSSADSDGDEVLDQEDNCPCTYNPEQEDSDGDGCGDACDGRPDDSNWVSVYGTIRYNSTPLCAMVLANGQYMFTCGDNLGLYDLDVPLGGNGEITLYGFCSGQAPFKIVLNPAQALCYDIPMVSASAGSAEMTIVFQTAPGTTNSNWVRIWGTVTYGGQDLCAMVLANGQNMFSCGVNLGTFDLEVPLGGNGEITLYVFCSGMAPYKNVFVP